MRPPQLLFSSPVISWPRTLMFSWDCSRRLITTLERARQTMTMCQSCSILTWCSVRVWESILPSPLTLEGELIIYSWLHQSWDMRGSSDTLRKTTSPWLLHQVLTRIIVQVGSGGEDNLWQNYSSTHGSDVSSLGAPPWSQVLEWSVALWSGEVCSSEQRQDHRDDIHALRWGSEKLYWKKVTSELSIQDKKSNSVLGLLWWRPRWLL